MGPLTTTSTGRGAALTAPILPWAAVGRDALPRLQIAAAARAVRQELHRHFGTWIAAEPIALVFGCAVFVNAICRRTKNGYE
jgi:hypothetical protein